MCWCKPDPGRRSWILFSTRSRVSPRAGSCRRAASRPPHPSGAAMTRSSSASRYLSWHSLVIYQPKLAYWRIDDRFPKSFFSKNSVISGRILQMSAEFFTYLSSMHFLQLLLHVCTGSTSFLSAMLQRKPKSAKERTSMQIPSC